ncbi:MAG: thioesterase family protein [Bacteroidota bacterium]|nr:thioesterase family protein [Bacteroidota bacterium]
MEIPVFKSNVLWAQIDGNLHLRHSAYADFAAQARVLLLDQIGLNFKSLAHLKIGPILFREESIYLREVRLNDSISVTSLVTKSNADASRWSFRHEIYRSDNVKAAIINVDGAWIDVAARKLTTLPEEIIQKLIQLPRSEDYQAL